MRDADELRERAAQMQLMAIEAREAGKRLLAEEITRLLMELIDQADQMDRGMPSPPEGENTD